MPIYPEPSNDFDEPTVTTEQEEAKEKAPKVVVKTVVLPDGSYGTQTIVVSDDAAK
ncbi:MAG: hypothetical protein ACK521_02715 [bacterium]